MTYNKIDLNCDLGESYGAYTIGQDKEILTLISSANIACGYHAGDPIVMAKTIEMCLENKVAIGAHPGYPDLQGFGRRDMSMSHRELYCMTMYQIAALKGMTEAAGGFLHHVKPHGALYNLAARDHLVAQALAEAVYHVAPTAILYGLANSELVNAGDRIGLQTAHEVFADRTYQSNGQLTPRSEPNSIIKEASIAVQQVLQMIESGTVNSLDGTPISIKADTVCLHGDHPSAVAFARELKEHLRTNDIMVEAIPLVQ